MKRIFFIGVILLISLLTTVCFNSSDSLEKTKGSVLQTENTDSSPTPDTQTEKLPADIIRDVMAANRPFNCETVSAVEFNLELQNKDNNSIDSAQIKITDGKDNLICVTKSEKGKINLTAAINKTTKQVKITIQHLNYEERIIEIEDINKYLEINRTLFMATCIKDQKLDDFTIQDEYTDDTHYLFARKKFIVAYEDLYPVVGDADFNDTVALLDINIYTEKTMRYVNKVVVKTTILAAGTGYYHESLRLNIIGDKLKPEFEKTDIVLIDNVRDELKNENKQNYNCIKKGTKGYSDYYQAETRITEIDYDPTVCTLHFPPMPFDPYMVVHGDDGPGNLPGGTREVHLPMVQTPFEEMVTGTITENGDGYQNFPWALIFPEELLSWKWPLENWGPSDVNDPDKATIFKAYPDFKGWYLSEGAENAAWYLFPDENWTYNERE